MKKSLYFAFFSIFAFFCVFKPVFAHTINWYADNNIYTTTCNSGDNITPPTAPAKYGYTFKEWEPEYVFYDYISIPAAGFIDTGISFDANTDEIEVELNISLKSYGSYQKYFGSSDAYQYQTGTASIILFSKSYQECVIGVGKGQSGVMTDAANRHTYKTTVSRIKNRASVYRDNDFVSEFDTGVTSYFEDLNFYLGLLNRNGTGVGSGVCDVSFCRITKDGVLVRDFIPAKRTSDNQFGFYDRVSGNFFENIGSGAFVGGND